MTILLANPFCGSIAEAIRTSFHELGLGTPCESFDTSGQEVGTEIVKSSRVLVSKPELFSHPKHDERKNTKKMIYIMNLYFIVLVQKKIKTLLLIQEE